MDSWRVSRHGLSCCWRKAILLPSWETLSSWTNRDRLLWLFFPDLAWWDQGTGTSLCRTGHLFDFERKKGWAARAVAQLHSEFFPLLVRLGNKTREHLNAYFMITIQFLSSQLPHTHIQYTCKAIMSNWATYSKSLLVLTGHCWRFISGGDKHTGYGTFSAALTHKQLFIPHMVTVKEGHRKVCLSIWVIFQLHYLTFKREPHSCRYILSESVHGFTIWFF